MLNFKITESQKLAFAKGPIVAADTTNLYAHFAVNDLFTGTLRSYWNVRGSAVDPFTVDLDEEYKCLIPSEVLANISDPDMYGDIDHILQVSIVSIGEDDTARITSSVCELPVYKSAYSGNTSQPSAPSGGGNVTNIITGAAVNGEQMDFYNGNTVIFSTSLVNLKKFLLPLSGGTMTGPIDMGGHKITNLGDAEDDGDTIPYRQAKDTFADAHTVFENYQLRVDMNIEPSIMTFSVIGDGGPTTSLANRRLIQINAISQGGLSAFLAFGIKANNGAPLYPLCTHHGNLRIQSIEYETIEYTTNYKIAFIADTTALYGRGTIFVSDKYANNDRVIKIGTYTEITTPSTMEIEWENPPMVLGVEYRTTERYMGYPVYTKLINCGEVVNGKRVDSGHGNTFRHVGFLNLTHTLPYGATTKADTVYYAESFSDNGVLVLYSGSGFTSGTYTWYEIIYWIEQEV